MLDVVLACRWAVAMTFAIALVGKTRSRHAFNMFVKSLTEIAWLPLRLHLATALVTVVIEGAIVASVLVPRIADLGLAIAVLMLGAVTTGIGLALRRGNSIACRCFGAGATPWGTSQFIRNGLLAAIAITGLLADAWVAASADAAPAGLLVAAGSALMCALIVARWDDLAFLMTPNRR